MINRTMWSDVLNTMGTIEVLDRRLKKVIEAIDVLPQDKKEEYKYLLFVLRQATVINDTAFDALEEHYLEGIALGYRGL